MKRITGILIVMVVALACSREDKIRYSFAGVWNLQQLDVSWYSDNSLDSTYTANNIGTWVMSDNHSSQYNNLHYIHTKTAPQSFIDFLQPASLPWEEGYTSWYSDFSTATRLTCTETLYIGSTYVIYTVLEINRNRMVLQYVIPDSSNTEFLSYKEVLTFERN